MGIDLHLCKWRQPRPVQVQLFLQRLGREEESTGQRSREADIQDPSRRRIQVRLDVEDENILDRHREHRWHALQEVTQQRRQEMLLGHVLEADGDAAAQHVLGDDEDAENTLGRNAVDAIWRDKRRPEEGKKQERWMNVLIHEVYRGWTTGLWGDGAGDKAR